MKIIIMNECECGCGGLVKPGNRFIRGHDKMKPQLCECGCGDYAKPGNRFIIGHNTRIKESEDTPNWQGGGITKICELCGKEYNCDKCKDITSHFCSRECYSIYQSRNLIGENNPSWNGGKVKRYCKQCNNEYFINKEVAKKSNFCSRKCQAIWNSINTCGENNPNWKGGISFDPYCEKFNKSKKKEIRDKYGNCDYLTGIHRNICNVVNGKVEELSVHHFDYNKQQGCNGYKWKLIPVSRSHNSMFNSNRPFWTRLIEYALIYDKIYYNEELIL